jgi:hypothetical protein
MDGFEHLLFRIRRAEITTEPEAYQTRKILAQQQCKLEQLSGKLKEATVTLAKLVAEEAEVKRIHDACRSLLSPIRRLPPELLGIIFVYCLPGVLFVRPTKSEAPLLLTRICASWRAIAFSIPELWSSLNVVYHITGRGKDRSKFIDNVIAPSMGCWLSRSGSLPLSISIDGIAMKQSILDVLFRHSAHCRRLQLKSVQPCPGLRIPDGHFLILEQLHLHGIVQTGYFMSSFASAPKLYEVSWEDGPHSDGPAPPLSLPWAQLKRLTLGSNGIMFTSMEMLLDILTMCPLLEHTSIAFKGINFVPPRSQILLPHLSSLVLRAIHTSDNYTPIFIYLTTPCLRSLTCVFGTAWPARIFSSFINRSACTLENIFLRNLSRLTQIAEYLQIVNCSVKCLTIYHSSCIITDELLDLLTPTYTTPCLCPNLEILNLIGCVSRSPGALATMVRSRLLRGKETIFQSANGAKLKKLGVSYTERDLDELRGLQKLGLTINLDTTDLGNFI